MSDDAEIVPHQEMMPIPIQDFISGVSVPVDLYVRLSDQKFILLVKRGTKASPDQMSSYKEKTVTYLWAKKSDYHMVSQQNIALAGVVVAKEQLSVKQKTRVLSTAANTVFHELEHIGLSLGAYQNARQVTEAVVTMLEHHKGFAALIESLNQHSDELLRHSMAVSVLSPIVGQALEWEKRATLEKLALGGLLHDIGKKSLPPELLSKPKAQMSFEEHQLYETHPFRGLELLQTLGCVPDDVVSIVYEHHENAIGQGFPQRLRDVKIHPLARVVGLVDQFVNLTVRNVQSPNPKSPAEALVYMAHIMGQPYNKEVFRALEKVVTRQNGSQAA